MTQPFLGKSVDQGLAGSLDFHHSTPQCYGHGPLQKWVIAHFLICHTIITNFMYGKAFTCMEAWGCVLKNVAKWSLSLSKSLQYCPTKVISESECWSSTKSPVGSPAGSRCLSFCHHFPTSSSHYFLLTILSGLRFLYFCIPGIWDAFSPPSSW